MNPHVILNLKHIYENKCDKNNTYRHKSISGLNSGSNFLPDIRFTQEMGTMLLIIQNMTIAYKAKLWAIDYTVVTWRWAWIQLQLQLRRYTCFSWDNWTNKLLIEPKKSRMKSLVRRKKWIKNIAQNSGYFLNFGHFRPMFFVKNNAWLVIKILKAVFWVTIKKI